MATKTKCRLNPTEDRVIVRKVESEEKTAGGILIPDSVKEKPQMGYVVKTGPGKTTEKGEVIAMKLKEGQKVVFAKYAGTEIKDSGEDYLIIRESDILAVVEE